jgi:hypothetical protein
VQGEQSKQYDQHPAVKFAPPARASDDKYDVHPPLNRTSEPPKKEEQKKEQPAKTEEKRAPPPKSK